MVKEVIANIASDLSNGRLIFLAGAGISIDPPTCFPAAIPLSNLLLEVLCKQAGSLYEMVFCGESYPKAFVDPFRAVARRIFPGSTATAKAALRLEVILEELFHAFGAAGLDCLQFMKNTQPNPYHQILAGFSGAGCSILTTNFDAAIESACKQAGIQPTLVASENDYLKPAEELAEQKPIVKLHGDIAGSAENLGATLTNLEHGLSRPRRSLLDELLRGAHLVLVGYSASDHFDINPYLVTKQFPRITWLQYNSTLPASFEITRLEGGRVTAGYPKSFDGMAVPAILLKNAEDGWWIEGEVELFRKTLQRILFGSEGKPEECASHNNWRDHINSWGEQLDPAVSAYVIGRLAQGIGLATLARSAYSTARAQRCYFQLPPAKRAVIELQEEYLLSLTGRYAEREKLLRDFQHKWAAQKAELKEEWWYLQLLVDKKMASCKIFADRSLAALWYLTTGVFGGLVNGLLRCRRTNREVWAGIVREIYETNTDAMFMMRIYPRRWFFSTPACLLHLGSRIEPFFRFLLNGLFFAGKGGLINRIRALQYSGRNEAEELFSAPHYYLEVENLLGLTNTLRERALRIISEIRRGKHARSTFLAAQRLLRQSIFVSRQIDDKPGLAKGCHHLAWIAYQRRQWKRLSVLCQVGRHHLLQIDAPRWRALRLREIEQWGEKGHSLTLKAK